MKKTFLRALLINSLFQFFVTRYRAGRMVEEGAAELLWLRFPFVVFFNALFWTLLLAAVGRASRAVRSIR